MDHDSQGAALEREPQAAQVAHPDANASVPHSIHASFPWLVFLLALLAASAAHWVALDLFSRWAQDSSMLLAVVLSFASTCVCASWLRRDHHSHPWPKTWFQHARQFLLVWLVFGAGIWFAVAAEHWLKDGPLDLQDHTRVFLLLSAAAVAGLSLWHSRLLPGFYRPRSLEPVFARLLPPGQELEALVLCVSPPNCTVKVAPFDSVAAGLVAEVVLPGGVTASLKGKSLTEDIQTISTVAAQAGPKVRWNWQQLLRAIEPHPHLRSIWLIGSPGSEGSAQALARCQKLLESYTTASINCHPEPCDFEDFNALVGAIRGLLQKPLRGIASHLVAVDITGGQKVASIAGAALTMNRELRFQYVQTNSPFEAITYQLTFDQPPSPHGH
jgi:hypothetical protein